MREHLSKLVLAGICFSIMSLSLMSGCGKSSSDDDFFMVIKTMSLLQDRLSEVEKKLGVEVPEGKLITFDGVK